MRHGKRINHLSRTSAHRRAMLSNMAASLILHKRITTTIAKAKVLRTFIEPLISRSKDDSTHNRRMVFGYLQNKEAVSELFREISKKIAERPGGYTRILKTGTRSGDNADMCIIELVDYNENLLRPKEEVKVKATRRRRGITGKKKAIKEVAEKPEETEETEETQPEVSREEKPKRSRKKTKKAPPAEEEITENDTIQEESGGETEDKKE